jgi:modification methylase|tara:strand:- start:458 stop:1285 length:828 start_codon:yes stop_codon:yes gene_type:complete
MVNEIRKGDTLDVLRGIDDNVFDGGVTSPPYNKKNNRKGVLVKDINYTDITDSLPEEEYQESQIDILNELYRTIKPGGSFFYNHKIRWDKGVMFHPYEWLSKTDWVIKQEIVWDRSLAANIRGWRFWQTEERIYWLYKPKKKGDNGAELLSKHALLTSVWKLRPEMNKKTVNNHPAPFPIEIPTRCIYSIFDNNEGKLIIDPYMGSGTLAVVCKLLKQNYFGIEISDTYINQSLDRLENITDKERSDFQNEIDLHIVKKTYKDRKREKIEKNNKE